jgi:hypothetical protein
MLPSSSLRFVPMAVQFPVIATGTVMSVLAVKNSG